MRERARLYGRAPSKTLGQQFFIVSALSRESADVRFDTVFAMFCCLRTKRRQRQREQETHRTRPNGHSGIAVENRRSQCAKSVPLLVFASTAICSEAGTILSFTFSVSFLWLPLALPWGSCDDCRQLGSPRGRAQAVVTCH